MKLYELSNDFQTLFDSFEDFENDESLTAAWFDTLDCIEAEFEEKAENVAAYIKSLKAEITQLKAEEDSLKERRIQKTKQAENLSDYLLKNMQAVNLLRIDKPMAKITVRNNAETAVFSDEKAFVDWAKNNNDDLLRYKEPEINRTEVKKFLQSGKEIPGVTLGRKKSLTIK